MVSCLLELGGSNPLCRTGQELIMWCDETSVKKAGKGMHVAFRFDSLIGRNRQPING